MKIKQKEVLDRIKSSRYSHNKFKVIEKITRQHRLVIDRINHMEKVGIRIERVPMGSGGVLQKKLMKNGEIRIQISYGYGRHNYAYVAIIG